MTNSQPKGGFIPQRDPLNQASAASSGDSQMDEKAYLNEGLEGLESLESSQARASDDEEVADRKFVESASADLARYKEAVAEGAVDQGLVQEMLAKFEEAEQRAKVAEQEVAAMIETAGRSVRKHDKPFVGEGGGYEFIVFPKKKSLRGVLKPQKVTCCDESEAIRWYICTNEYPPGSGKQVDPVHVQIQAKITTRRRNENVMFRQRLATVRNKVNNGSQLSSEDSKLFEQYRDEILGFRQDKLEGLPELN